MAGAPTCEQIYYEDGLKSVSRKADDSWRHGSYVTEVFKREADQTYWQAVYALSTDGETNELRSGDALVDQVKPVEKTVVDYVKIDAP